MTLLNQTKLSVTELHYKISIHRHQAPHNVNVISQPQMFRKDFKSLHDQVYLVQAYMDNISFYILAIIVQMFENHIEYYIHYNQSYVVQ
jgi:hypothetical protein